MQSVQTPDSSPQAYSKDYWDLVFEQLGRNRLFKITLAILAVLYASAIYAPLIANDRPYVIVAANYRDYGRALRTLYPATIGLGRILRQTPDEYSADRTGGSSFSYEEALENEHQAVLVQLATMKSYLPADRAAELDDFVARIDSAVAAGRGGAAEAATAGIRECKRLAKEIRTNLRPLDPEHPEKGGVRLASVRLYPLFEAISGTEAFFMFLCALALSWPLWNRLLNRHGLGDDRERIRQARKKKWVGALLLSALVGGLWGVTIGGGADAFNVAPYKGALTKGEIVPERVVFPPIPFGFAETHSAENFRPPTWAASAEISAEGYYVSGPRRPEADKVSGFMPPPTPVDVRFSEPERNAPLRHILGTDSVGRDFLTRLLWGGRVSLSVGLLSACLLVVIGTIVGSIAGFFGGRVDILVSRFIEIVLCVPPLFLILMVSAFVDPELIPPIFSIVVIIALIRWTGVARLVRGEFLRLREEEFALAARALGFSSMRTIFIHILPNALAPVLVSGAFAVASGILMESTLSFLGFGIQHPIPSWGSLINESRMAEHWWIQIFPGLLIFITITCYNQVGDAFRDALDPKMKRH
jgi:peptide/nickel transport system permease protein